MSFMLEQSLSDVALLKGATVVAVGINGDVSDDYGYECIEITFALDPPVTIDGALCDRAAYEVLCDPEGNGPGFLALSKTRLV